MEDSSTPAPTVSSDSAVSAPSTPTPSATAESRPTSFQDSLSRFVAGDPATPTPETSEADATAPVPAIEAPQQPTDAPAGEPPQDKWPTILTNARKKEREVVTQEVEQRFQQQYGGHVTLGEAIKADLPGTLGRLVSEALAHPEHGDTVRAMLGRAFGGLRQKAPQADPVANDPEPQRFVEQNGERFFDPSADAKWQEWNQRRLEQSLSARLEQKFAPLTTMQQEIKQAQAVTKLQNEARATVNERLGFWLDQPGFKDHKAAIGAKQKELFDQHQGRMDEWTALGLAYAQVVPPRLQQQSATDLQARAAAKSAGRTDNPASATPAPPRRPRSAREALEQFVG